ncbi:MAG: 1-phosphofructokinase [Clostridia bacterium]|nr:1-phosphofructokinase [Clostridia bacterium]
MIYTVTLNPSLDYVMNIENLNLGLVNRSAKEVKDCGGKGLNISRMLTNLGVENIALGFVGGDIGTEILEIAKKCGVITDFVTLSKGVSRINVKLRHGQDTEINAVGPEITATDMEKFIGKIIKLKEGDTLILAGNLQPSVSEDFYSIIGSIAKNNGVRVVVDATGNQLVLALKSRPFMIKPNIFELEEIFNVKINTRDEIIKYAKKLKNMGADNVIVSLGKAGAMLIAMDENIYEVKAPEIETVYTVGSGDSLDAGFIYGYDLTKSFEKALKWGVACGCATASSEGIGTGEKAENIYLSII